MLLTQNPFYILGASTRDTRSRLIELAEEKGLSLDPEVCSKARAELTNPRQRLHAELAWLPAMSPNAAAATVKAALAGTPGLAFPNPVCRINATLTGLAHANVAESESVASSLVDLAATCDLLDAGQAQVVINEDRQVAGFPPVSTQAEIEAAAAERLDQVVTACVAILRSRPEDVWLTTLTRALDMGTCGGGIAGPTLLHRIVDRMAVDLEKSMEKAAVGVGCDIGNTERAATSGDSAIVDAALKGLGTSVRRWDYYAQPLQLSAKARGQAHEASRGMHSSLRGLALKLNNEHDLTEAAREVTALLAEVFAEDLRLSEGLQADKEALDELLAKKESARDMERVLAEMTPVDSAPVLATLYGIGTCLYGRRDEHLASNTYVATQYFTVLFVPIIPLQCYRVRQVEGNRWRFFGTVPFSKANKVHLWSAIAAVLLLIVLGASSDSSGSSYYSASTSYSGYSSGSADYSGGGYSAPANNYLASGKRDRHEQLGQWIESEKTRLDQVGATLKAAAESLDRSRGELDGLERQWNLVSLQASPDGTLPQDLYDRYETSLSRYNSAVDEYNRELERYKADIEAANDSVLLYNIGN